MTATRCELGRCPLCGETIPQGRKLIEYEKGCGTAVYAECPACEGVVHPESGPTATTDD